MTHYMVQDPVAETVDRIVAALDAGCPLELAGAVLDDAESRRGEALLEESALAAESPARLARDRQRLFVGGDGRLPTAPLAAPAESATALAQLGEEMRCGGELVPERPADLVDVLRLYAALGPARPDEPSAPAEWRQRLVQEHLLTWGARCLTRMQLGAQTFYYQGVAALGLGLLRHVTDELPWRSAS